MTISLRRVTLNGLLCTIWSSRLTDGSRPNGPPGPAVSPADAEWSYQTFEIAHRSQTLPVNSTPIDQRPASATPESSRAGTSRLAQEVFTTWRLGLFTRCSTPSQPQYGQEWYVMKRDYAYFVNGPGTFQSVFGRLDGLDSRTIENGLNQVNSWYTESVVPS